MAVRKRKRMVVANWKMNPSSKKEALALFEGIKKKTQKIAGVEIVICPPYPYLSLVMERYRGSKILFGAQDAFFEQEGSFTGEVSPGQLADLGAKYVIIGHSERRREGESNEDVSRKVRATLDAKKLSVILCVGEKERDDLSGDHFNFVAEEIETALEDVSERELGRVVIAYEPIWAIGKSADEAMTPHQIHETALFIRKVLSGLFNRKLALAARLLYGGSVEASNAERLLDGTDVSGFLVGHASLQSDEFARIIQIASRT